MTRIVVDKSTKNTKPHLIRFLPQYQRQRKRLFFSEPEQKRHCVTHVWTLIDNGKLANQIARLVAIVVKIGLSELISRYDVCSG